MGYPEDALAGDEQLLLHRHPHWKMLFWPAVTFVLITALAGFALGLVQNKVESDNPKLIALIAIAVVWVGVVAWRVVPPFIRWRATHFIVTDRRVLIRHGVLTHTGIDIPMGRISSVQFRHGLFDRMLGTGTLIIGSASEDPLEFDDIPKVQKVHSLLYHQVFDAMQIDRNDDGRPDNPGRRRGYDDGGPGGPRNSWGS
ncbi:PH domain-containing protein [Antrihabitans sp. YC2-6]|uniref:PH domain-containing protein n=1 Tax=Antrihabitans sp. YC2-6 TaxID=2799498 RepID=UPI0018F37E2E|nr:PH domain-containing protein [Antrihabitans sp. YC2-6]MBJ8347334.1 PH domain-containing protein [Antrihabitans sp. YC2-6]